MNSVDFEFLPPPEAPVFEPTAEEFKDPLAYIAKIRPIAEKTGICKIKPPPEWQPPFAVDVDNFRFTPRMQRLNELEATTRVKLNFLDQIAKFWELQGSSLKIPNVERKALDLFTLYRVVLEEGGSEVVSRERRWSRIATRMGYPPGRGLGSLLRQHYERILYPYHVFQEGTTLDPTQGLSSEGGEEEGEEEDYVPHGIPSRQAVRPPPDRYARRSKRCKEEERLDDGIDYSCNNELKKLQFYGAGPKMPGFPATGGKVEQEEALKENHLECFKDVKMGGGARDLQMGFGGGGAGKMGGGGGGGNFLQETRSMGQALGSLLLSKRRNADSKGSKTIEQMVCCVCSRGDEEASMLLCDGCDDSYHTFCLIPPINEIPKGEWRCPCCVAKEVNKPQEAFGFEQAQREYTLQEFGQKADEFKTSYFNMPVHRVPFSLVEREFWRVVNAVDEDVTVEYGADLHTVEHGSGFPKSPLEKGDEEYVMSGWNLNNLPVLEGSVLRHINADISGMKIPWTYVGMCFATFCWHNEDHWSYSINYLHWGEPKTWYGVPGGSAESFEEAMRSVAPELFSAQPDLLHQLVTIMNPNLLQSQGVPICRTNQQAGEFVITFPRSYHAGFNQGYNFAEAVNFAPADWLPIGRVCVSHYGLLHRFCVFSHDELVCKMASEPEGLDVSVAASTYQDMLRMVEGEREQRRTLLNWGVTRASREVFELLPDDERQCAYCKTTCFLSAVTCSCTHSGLVCIPHRDKLCDCLPEKHCLLYRYTLDELPSMLCRLKARAESFDCWSLKVQKALEAPPNSKQSLGLFREWVQEGEEKGFPSSLLLQDAVEEGERCTLLAQQLLSRRGRTRTRHSGGGEARLTLDDLRLFHQQLDTLACEIKEAALVKDLLERALAFQSSARGVLRDDRPELRKLERCLEAGLQLDMEVPEIPQLKQRVSEVRWLEEVRGALGGGGVTLGVLRGLLGGGGSLPPSPPTEKVMAELQEMITFGERWEEKAKSCLHARPRLSLQSLEGVVREAGTISVHLPNVLQLTEVVRKARDWMKRVQAMQSGSHNPYLEVLEGLVSKGRGLACRLDQLAQMEAQAEGARAWREKTQRTFLLRRPHHPYTLLEVLTPRKDIGCQVKKKKKKEEEGEEMTEENREPAVIVATFKEAERRELEAVLALRAKNELKQEEEGAKFCVCQRPPTPAMLECQLCRDAFHVGCVHGGGSGSNGRWLCPVCVRSRRPRLETILSLLMSLQKIPVRLGEGEALQCLTERGMAWQDRAKQLLKSEEVSSALRSLTHHSDDKGSTEAEVKEQPPQETGGEIETVDLTGEAYSTEHAYSSASKTATASTSGGGGGRVKHSRKSPLLPRRLGGEGVRLNEVTRLQLEQLQVEGDLLEMSLDEAEDIGRLLQATRPHTPFYAACTQDTPSTSVRTEKKKPKRQKVEGATKSVFVKSKVNKETKKKRSKQEVHFRREDGSVMRTKLFAPRSKRTKEDEMCSASSCLRPIGESVNWVQCDGGCEQWFHLLCVGLDLTEVSEAEDYICSACSPHAAASVLASLALAQN